jgi:hypothetical protein
LGISRDVPAAWQKAVTRDVLVYCKVRPFEREQRKRGTLIPLKWATD